MPEAVKPGLLVPFEPDDLPGLVALWDFQRSGERFVADRGEPYALISRSGALMAVDDPEAPFGGRALRLDEGQWLAIPRAACPRLDIHGPEGQLSLIAWLRRDRTAEDRCEFVAGQWNESGRSRQYGLFLNIDVWRLTGSAATSPTSAGRRRASATASTAPWAPLESSTDAGRRSP